MKSIIKPLISIFHPEIWYRFGHYYYLNQVDNAQNVSVNSVHDLLKAEFLVVHHDIDTQIKVPENIVATIYVPGEDVSAFPNYPQQFLDQFDHIITNRRDLRHRNVIASHYLHPWQVQKTKQDLIGMQPLLKTKDLSGIISSLIQLDGHKKRYAFINRMKGHFKERMDWFSKHENPINDKWDGLAPYQYSFAIENSCNDGYFTEKISDCFLSYTMPIYHGALNITQYFDDRSFIKIDMENWTNTIYNIEEAIQMNLYKKNLKHIVESRNLVLQKYNFISGLYDKLENLYEKRMTGKQKMKIKPLSTFVKGGKIKPIIEKIRSKIL